MPIQTELTSQPKELSVLQDLFYFPSTLIKKFIPLGLMLSFIALSYVFLRDTKDALIVGSPQFSPGSVFFLNSYILPLAKFLFAVLYIFLCHILSRDRLFYSTLVPFLFFSAVFVIRPTSINGFSVFYILASLWGPIIMTVMFGQISNEIMSIKEAKKTYILLDLFAGSGLILGGFISRYFFNAVTLTPFHPETLITNVNYSIIFFFISFMAILALYDILFKKILTKQYLDVFLETESVTNVVPLSFLKSLVDIFKSPYIWLIVAIMFSSDLTAQLLNLSWKSKMGLYFSGSRGQYNQMMGTLAMTIGYLSICFLPIGYIILARCRWLTAAFIPPILTLFMGLLFFSIILYTDSMDPATPFMGTTFSKVIIWIGYVSGKSQMFLGLFYATLLIAYIPLNENLKTKGRAIVELILAGGIKSLAMFFVNSLIMSTTLTSGMIQFTRFTPAAIIFLILTIIIWMFCVRSLGKRFEILGKESEWKRSPHNFS